jgi:predicted transposase YdaD
MPDHDRLFKQLLSTFFLEFLALFVPELAREVEADSVEFLEKETFTDAVAGHHHVVDLLARVRVLGAPGCILVHVETQAQAKAMAQFPQRMFRYFAGLEARHGLPIYPVAVLSYTRSRTLRPSVYEMNLPGLNVLRFCFRQIQLSRLHWREYVRHTNPVAAALMSRMRIARDERWRVKLECLRLLARLRLDRAKSRLISSFVDTYLKLGREEGRLFEKELQAMPADERENVMELTTSWKEEGRAEGRAEGRVEGRHDGAAGVVLRQLHRRLGDLPQALIAHIEALRIEDLERLAEDLLDFAAVADLERWLGGRR